MRKPVIGVMGGANVGPDALATATRLGALIARHGWVLLNGGRDAGVMAASARGARQAGGTVIGVLPDRNAAHACPDLDYAIITGLGDGRNLINALSSDVVVACPGGAGTLSEIALAVKNDKPLVLLDFDPGPALEPYRNTGLIESADCPEQAVEKIASLLDRGHSN